jgi:hypothetical protein
LLTMLSACGGGGAGVSLQSIAITPNPVTTGVGISQQLIATGTYSNGTKKAVTTVANWASNTPSVATIGATTGLATGASTGSATITATVGFVTATTPLTVVANAWVSTASMTTARVAHTATLLSNGTVLVAGGGNNSISSLASAEIYDPVADAWTVTGSMSTARAEHTATLLTNGTVLVVAGGDPCTTAGTPATAEIYDPVAGTWSVTGSMTTALCYGHTTTLLPNGTVLVAGGASYSGSMNSAEIYDPAAGTWTLTGSMTTARADHTATLLPNGTVLVAGGGAPGGPWNSAEIYDPATGTWTVTGSMSAGRDSHTATLLPNGIVLVAGGFGVISVPNSYLSGAEIYAPVSATWTVTGSLITARVFHTATLLPNGTALVAGGFAPGGSTDTAEIYAPVSGTWTVTGSLITGREHHTATLLPNGTVLAAGGVNDSGNISSAEIFYP